MVAVERYLWMRGACSGHCLTDCHSAPGILAYDMLTMNEIKLNTSIVQFVSNIFIFTYIYQ